MALHSVSALVETISASGLLTPAQMAELTSRLLPRFNDPRALARELLQRSWFTAYQLNQFFQGRVAELFVDQYVLLERLGEGGMGQVFKARHRHMGRLVALKVLRREKLDNAEAIKRFYREVQAVAQLSHPNIVTAYDAGDVDGACFFAMEYIDGTDLGKLVKKNGPLPVEAACDYIRQAALGLQHAYEKGLVHRDIKPSNLLLGQSRSRALQGPHLTGPGGERRREEAAVVKILDLGLARLHPAFEPDASGTLTQIHTVLGTPDFIAPEQARNARTADIRSDLYSLGCTFYFLLTGEVPFPADSPMEKLLKHYLEAPRPVEELRARVPTRVARVVRRLMAKLPEDRYQTPAELAAALQAAMQRTPAPIPVVSGPGGPPAPPPRAPDDEPAGDVLQLDTLAEHRQELDTDDSLTAVPPTRVPLPGSARGRPRGRWARFLVAALVVVLTVALVAVLIWFGES